MKMISLFEIVHARKATARIEEANAMSSGVMTTPGPLTPLAVGPGPCRAPGPVL